MTQQSESRRSIKSSLYYLLFSLLAQSVGFAAGLVASEYLGVTGIALSLIHGIVACIISRWLKMPPAWQAANLLLPPGIVLYVELKLPAGILLLAFIITVLIYLPVIWSGIPYYPTSRKTYAEIAKLLPADKSFTMLDIGCGFSGLLFYLSKRFPEGKFTGVEIGPVPYLLSKLKTIVFRPKNVEILFKDFWKMDFSSYDVIYAFLAPGPMERLWQKVKSEMKPGSIFITNTFEVEAKADQVVVVEDYRVFKLYLFRM
ncbi:MAG: class I SAM-dependent methyltransferase [Candidatus Dadabacteria bacterium]|nr:MAG: class I SAM-dependent methyltransferase [Candidatus Dadabacteria bacterium]